MAPRLAQSQRIRLHDMIQSSTLPDQHIADIVSCSIRTVVRLRANIRVFGDLCAPKNNGGRHSRIPPHALTALLDYLLAKPELYLDEMTDFIWNQFELDVSEDSVRRSLKANGWTKKKNRQVARERDPELRDACLHELSEYKSFQLIFVDEPGVTHERAFAAPAGRHGGRPQSRPPNSSANKDTRSYQHKHSKV